jgi:hypothetical protein
MSTKTNTTSLQRRLAIDGETGMVTVGELDATAGLEGSGVCLGFDPAGLGYANVYESVGVNNPTFNLRLQSPNWIVFHTANQVRGSVDNGGNFRMSGNLGTRGLDPVAGLPDGWGGGVHTFDVYAEGSVAVGTRGGYSSWISASGLNGKTKNFVIDHPLDEDRQLVHSAIEGPEHSVFYRGEGRLEAGRATIGLPRYFEALCREDERSVQVTPKVSDGACRPGVLGVTEVRDGRFQVIAGHGCDADQAFFWEVTAVRMDVAPLDPEPLRGDSPLATPMGHRHRKGDDHDAR